MKAKKTLVIMLLTLTVFIPTKSFAINWFWESWGNSEEIGISEDQYEEEESEDDTSWWSWLNWWDSDEDDTVEDQYEEEESEDDASWWSWLNWWDSDEDDTVEDQCVEEESEDDASWWSWLNWWDSDEDDTLEDQYVEEETEDDTVEDASKTNSTSRSPQEIAESYGWTYDEENMAFCYGNIIF